MLRNTYLMDSQIWEKEMIPVYVKTWRAYSLPLNGSLLQLYQKCNGQTLCKLVCKEIEGENCNCETVKK